MAVDGRGSANRGVTHAGGQLRRRESIGIGLLVDETQGIDALKAPIEFDPAAVVDQQRDSGRGRQSSSALAR